MSSTSISAQPSGGNGDHRDPSASRSDSRHHPSRNQRLPLSIPTCEGCGQPTENFAEISASENSVIGDRQPTSDFEDVATRTKAFTVSCIGAGLHSAPLTLPASTSTLDLAGNLIRKIDVSFMEFSENFRVRPNNHGSGYIGPPRLVNVRLRGNGVESIAPGSFGSRSASTIRVLDLSDNRLNSVHPGVFAGPISQSLIVLDLSNNRIFGQVRILH